MSDSPLINIFLALIPVLSVTFYMLGLTYNEGYLGSYGIDPTIFILPSDVTLLYGFFTFLLIGFQPFYIAFLIIISILFIILVVVILSSDTRVKELQAKLTSYVEKIKPSQRTSGVINIGSTAYLYIFGVFLIVVLPYFLAFQSMKTGEKQAVHEKLEFKNQTGKWIMLYSSHSDKPVRAKQIRCSSSHCAFWLGDAALTLKHEEIEKIISYSSIPKESKTTKK